MGHKACVEVHWKKEVCLIRLSRLDVNHAIAIWEEELKQKLIPQPAVHLTLETFHEYSTVHVRNSIII
jgi:hypothetical protein